MSNLPLIFLNNNDAGYYNILTRVFNLPLCGMPKTMSVNPSCAADSKSWAKERAVVSAPSPEYLLNVTYFL